MVKSTRIDLRADDPIFSEGLPSFRPLSAQEEHDQMMEDLDRQERLGKKPPKMNGKKIDPLPTVERDSPLPDPAQALGDEMASQPANPGKTPSK
jgi:hypothetical protein